MINNSDSNNDPADYILETCDLCHHYFSIFLICITFENNFYCKDCMKEYCEVEVQTILKNIDWNKFWQDVNEKSLPEIEAYRKAEALSRNSNRVFYKR